MLGYNKIQNRAQNKNSYEHEAGVLDNQKQPINKANDVDYERLVAGQKKFSPLNRTLFRVLQIESNMIRALRRKALQEWEWSSAHRSKLQTRGLVVIEHHEEV